MAKKIRISGEIGWEVLPSDILNQLDSANGDDIDIDIASPGGSVFDGLEIFNGIRGYKKQHPEAQVMITITGIAASMASYIAAVDVADLVVAYDNTVGMYHFPFNIAIGDYREMRKNAEFLEGLSELMAKAYIKRSGKNHDEIFSMLGDETWLFGEELKEYGFVDEIIAAPEEDNGDQNRAAAISTAKMQFKEMVKHAKDYEEQPEKVAAMIQAVTGSYPEKPDNSKQGAKPVVDGEHKSTPSGENRSMIMDLKELQSNHPDVNAEAKSTYTADGVKQERERVASLMKMKQRKPYQGIAAVQELLDECISDGTTTEEANALVIATLTNNNTALAEGDNPQDFTATGDANTPTGETGGAQAKSGFAVEEK